MLKIALVATGKICYFIYDKKRFQSVTWVKAPANAAQSAGVSIIYIESASRLQVGKNVAKKVGFKGNVEKF